MIRWLHITTAVALVALLASPVEANQANQANSASDDGGGVWWHRAVEPAGPPAGKKVRVGLVLEGGSLKVERMKLESSTGTLKIFQPPNQQVAEQSKDDTESLGTNNTFTTRSNTVKAGAWFHFQPTESFFVEAGGGALFADVEIERTPIVLNVATKTGGNDWGGWIGGRAEFEPDPDNPFFLYAKAGKHWVTLDAERKPPEDILGANIQLDASRVKYYVFDAGTGVGFSIDQNRKFTFRMGVGYQDLDVQIDRTLHFLYPTLNQRQEFEGEIRLERKPWTFDASAHALITSFFDVEMGASLGSGARSVYFRTIVTR